MSKNPIKYFLLYVALIMVSLHSDGTVIIPVNTSRRMDSASIKNTSEWQRTIDISQTSHKLLRQCRGTTEVDAFFITKRSSTTLNSSTDTTYERKGNWKRVSATSLDQTSYYWKWYILFWTHFWPRSRIFIFQLFWISHYFVLTQIVIF